MFKGRT